MRISSKAQFAITASSVVIGDPDSVFQHGVPPELEQGRSALFFGEHIKAGEYGCYRKQDTLVIDFYPRAFRPKSRPEFECIGPKIPIRSGTVCIIDAGILPEVSSADLRVIELSPGSYWSWFEECEGSKYFHQGILGIGPKVDLVLAGSAGTDIYDLEMEVAALRSITGRAKGERMQSLRERVLRLHADGCKDRRLAALADALRIELPRRRPKKKT